MTPKHAKAERSMPRAVTAIGLRAVAVAVQTRAYAATSDAGVIVGAISVPLILQRWVSQPLTTFLVFSGACLAICLWVQAVA